MKPSGSDVKPAAVRAAARALMVILLAGSAGSRAGADEAPAGSDYGPPPPSVRMMDRITVVGSPGRAEGTAGSLHSLDTADLDKQNQAYGDIHRILLRVPGINITEEDGYGLRPNIGMRGTGTERSSNITVMEDGVLAAPAPYSAPAAYYFPVSGRMAGIEVRKGSSQIRFGPRTNGGALNLLSTPLLDRRVVRAGIAAGEDNSRKIHGVYGDTIDRVSWLFESYLIESDGFKKLDGGDPTGFDVEDYVGKIRLRSGPDASMYQELTFKGGYTNELSRETYLGLTEADFAETPFRRYAASRKDRMKTEHEQYLVRYYAEPVGMLDITTSLYRNEFVRNWYKLDRVNGEKIASVLSDADSYPEEYRILTGGASGNNALSVKANNRTYYSQGVEVIGGLHFQAGLTWHELEAGARLHGDEEDRFQHSDGYRMEEGGAMVPTEAGVPGAGGGGDNRVNSARAVALFIQDHALVGDWNITPGVRFEHITTTRKQYEENDPEREGAGTKGNNETDIIIPGIGVNYRWAPEINSFAGVHRGFAPPGPGADNDTRAETSINYEVGTRYSYRETSAGLVGFFNRYNNLLGKDTFASGGAGSGDLHNAGRVDSYGMEAQFAADAGAALALPVSLPVSISYTLTTARFRSAFSSGYEPWGDVEKGDHLPYLPTHQVSMGIGIDRPLWGMELFGNYSNPSRTTAGCGDIPPGEGTDGRLILDLSGECTIGPGSRAFVTIQNLADRTYSVARRPAGLRPGLPRRLVAGLKLEL